MLNGILELGVSWEKSSLMMATASSKKSSCSRDFSVLKPLSSCKNPVNACSIFSSGVFLARSLYSVSSCLTARQWGNRFFFFLSLLINRPWSSLHHHYQWIESHYSEPLLFLLVIIPLHVQPWVWTTNPRLICPMMCIPREGRHWATSFHAASRKRSMKNLQRIDPWTWKAPRKRRQKRKK